MDERVEQGVERAKKFIEEKKEDFDRYAIAWEVKQQFFCKSRFG